MDRSKPWWAAVNIRPQKIKEKTEKPVRIFRHETREGFDARNIEYPRNFNEWEIQAALYVKLREIGIDARAEVTAHRARFDIVVFDQNQKASIIIEVKDNNRISYKQKDIDRQREKYLSFGIPVLLCSCIDDINQIITSVTGILGYN